MIRRRQPVHFLRVYMYHYWRPITLLFGFSLRRFVGGAIRIALPDGGAPGRVTAAPRGVDIWLEGGAGRP